MIRPICFVKLVFFFFFFKMYLMYWFVPSFVWHYLQVQTASWAPTLTGQHSFFCCQKKTGTVFVLADSQHCPLWKETHSLMCLPERQTQNFYWTTEVCITKEDQVLISATSWLTLGFLGYTFFFTSQYNS